MELDGCFVIFVKARKPMWNPQITVSTVVVRLARLLDASYVQSAKSSNVLPSPTLVMLSILPLNRFSQFDGLHHTLLQVELSPEILNCSRAWYYVPFTSCSFRPQTVFFEMYLSTLEYSQGRCLCFVIHGVSLFLIGTNMFLTNVSSRYHSLLNADIFCLSHCLGASLAREWIHWPSAGYYCLLVGLYSHFIVVFDLISLLCTSFFFPLICLFVCVVSACLLVGDVQFCQRDP